MEQGTGRGNGPGDRRPSGWSGSTRTCSAPTVTAATCWCSPAGPGCAASPVEIAEVNSDQPVPVDGDIYLMGGGEDLPQVLAARRLRADGGLHAAADRGAVVFAVCAGYQIVGTEFGGPEGEPVPGLGLLDIRSGRGERRGVGEIIADVDPALGAERLTGFENHQGVTQLGPGAKPLATVLTGDRQRRRHRGRLRRPGGRHLPARPGAGPQPEPGRPAAQLGRRPLPPIDPEHEELVASLRDERLAAVSAAS